jgi:hypothetical protein
MKIWWLIVFIILCLLSSLTILQKECYAENWHDIASNPEDSSKWFIDLESVQSYKNNTISKSWIKAIYPYDEGCIMLTLINHKEKMFQFIQMEKYDSKGKHKHIDTAINIQHIPPGSVMEILENYLKIKYAK